MNDETTAGGDLVVADNLGMAEVLTSQEVIGLLRDLVVTTASNERLLVGLARRVVRLEAELGIKSDDGDGEADDGIIIDAELIE